MTDVVKRPEQPGIYKQYWLLYGGWSAFFTSSYFWCAMGVTGVSYWFWHKEAWWDTAIAILPNILGFSIAAFTMLLAFGHDRFLVVLSRRPSSGEASALEVTVAAFFHFLVVQVCAIITALLRKALIPLGMEIVQLSSKLHINYFAAKLFIKYIGNGISGIGFFLLCYSLFCALAASARLFNLALRFREVIAQDESRRLEHEEAELDAEYARNVVSPEEPRP